jgi:hypothetical protein
MPGKRVDADDVLDDLVGGRRVDASLLPRREIVLGEIGAEPQHVPALGDAQPIKARNAGARGA